MKQIIKESPSNPFNQGKDSREVMRELLRNSKSLTHEQALERMKETSEAQKKNK